MLPSDVTGVSIYNQVNREFEFRSGPIMAQIVLTDEINRATPKTQAALLEAMEERQVTVDGVTHLLPKPFMVMATQNPIEYEGTFPLPEAQLDRFLLRVTLGYPDLNDEIQVLERQQYQHPIELLDSVISEEEVLEAQEEVKKVHVAPEIKKYMVEMTRRTRDFPDVYLGASPRGSLTLFRTSQARAAIFGREFVLPDDVKALAGGALCHRVILGPAARLRDLDAAEVIDEILNSVPVPGGDLQRES
jgi:MoxR-like ATPase